MGFNVMSWPVRFFLCILWVLFAPPVSKGQVVDHFTLWFFDPSLLTSWSLLMHRTILIMKHAFQKRLFQIQRWLYSLVLWLVLVLRVRGLTSWSLLLHRLILIRKCNFLETAVPDTKTTLLSGSWLILVLRVRGLTSWSLLMHRLILIMKRGSPQTSIFITSTPPR